MGGGFLDERVFGGVKRDGDRLAGADNGRFVLYGTVGCREGLLLSLR